MFPRRSRATRAHSEEPCGLLTRVTFLFAACGSTPRPTMNLLTFFPRLVIVTLLLGICFVGSLPAIAADAPASADTYDDLRAATDAAVRRWSLGITSAFDDLIQTRWADRAVAESRAEGVQQVLQDLAVRALPQAGPPLPREFEYLGSLRTGSHNVRLCYLIRHAWSHYPLELGFLFINNQWRMTDLRVAASAQRLSTRFLQAEPAAHLRFDPASDPGSLKPTTLSDLKHACDAAVAKFSSGATSDVFLPLLQQHYVTPTDHAREAKNLEAQMSAGLATGQKAANRPLPGKFELVGITYAGTNNANLIYSLPNERGTLIWTFVLYRPATEWRLSAIYKNKLAEQEEALLHAARPATAPPLESDRPAIAGMERMMAGIAQADPGPVMEFYKQFWIDRAQTDKLAPLAQVIAEKLPSISDSYAKSLPNGIVYLGFLQQDSLTKNHCFVNLRDRGAFPVDSIFLLRNGQWQFALLNLEKNSLPQMERFIRYERRTSSPPATAQSPVLAPSDLAALEQSCARFMSNAVTGKLNGALHTLLKTHKFAGSNSSTFATITEAKAQTSLDALAKRLGRPLQSGAEYLGVGRLGDFLAKLTYQQYFAHGARLWTFTFYRRNGEWHLDELVIPEEDDIGQTPLSVVSRPPSQTRPEATPQSPAKP